MAGCVAKKDIMNAVDTASTFYEQFLDRELDRNPRDNLRFGILRKVVKPMLKYFSPDQL